MPVVSVLDGHSHALAFIGAALGVPQQALGVDEFGQSGARGICIGTTGSMRPPSRGRRRSCWAGYNSLNPMSTLTDSRKASSGASWRSIVGPGAVLSDPDELMVYESDGLTLFRALADFVVFPTIGRSTSRPSSSSRAARNFRSSPAARAPVSRRMPARRGRHRDLD